MPESRNGETWRWTAEGLRWSSWSWTRWKSSWEISGAWLAGTLHPEAGVGADVGAVAENVADGDHAPETAAAGLEVLFVEAAGDAADAEAVFEVEAEDVADDGPLFGDDDEAALGADAVAVRGRPSASPLTALRRMAALTLSPTLPLTRAAFQVSTRQAAISLPFSMLTIWTPRLESWKKRRAASTGLAPRVMKDGTTTRRKPWPSCCRTKSMSWRKPGSSVSVLVSRKVAAASKPFCLQKARKASLWPARLRSFVSRK